MFSTTTAEKKVFMLNFKIKQTKVDDENAHNLCFDKKTLQSYWSL